MNPQDLPDIDVRGVPMRWSSSDLRYFAAVRNTEGHILLKMEASYNKDIGRWISIAVWQPHALSDPLATYGVFENIWRAGPTADLAIEVLCRRLDEMNWPEWASWPERAK